MRERERERERESKKRANWSSFMKVFFEKLALLHGLFIARFGRVFQGFVCEVYD
jgi:hypothetical protein